MTVTTNYIITGNGVSGSSANALQTLVSPYGNYAIGSLAFEQTPNNTLTDTISTEQQMAVATIPGGLFGTNSSIEINLIGQCAGASATKTINFKIGPTSGTFATATNFGGSNGGLAAQYVGMKALLWGNGSVGSQRASPSGQTIWTGTTANVISSLAIDTNLDWNIYVSFVSGSTGGTNSFTLRKFWASWKT